MSHHVLSDGSQLWGQWDVHPCDKTPNSQDADGQFVSSEDSKGPYLSRLAMVRRGSSLDGCLWGVGPLYNAASSVGTEKELWAALTGIFFFSLYFQQNSNIILFPSGRREKSHPACHMGSWASASHLCSSNSNALQNNNVLPPPPLLPLSTLKTNMTKLKCGPVALTVMHYQLAHSLP